MGRLAAAAAAGRVGVYINETDKWTLYTGGVSAFLFPKTQKRPVLLQKL